MTTDHDKHWRWATSAPSTASASAALPGDGTSAAALFSGAGMTGAGMTGAGTTGTGMTGTGMSGATTSAAAAPSFPPFPSSSSSSSGAKAAAAPVLTAWARWRSALADRLPPTLQGRWGIDRTTGVILAVSILLSALLIGGWAVLRARPHELSVSRVQASGSGEAGAGLTGTPVAAADAQAVPESGLGGVPESPGGGAGAGGVASAVPGTVVIVDVEGKVPRPGVRTLPVGSRVIDALSAAGGALPGTDLSMLNQAQVLADGEQVLVGVTPPPGAAGSTPGRGGKGKGKSRAEVGEIEPVRLNTAAVEDLEQLPGIGPALAQRVVDYRTEHGPFHSVDELSQVSGFGGQRFETLAPLLTL